MDLPVKYIKWAKTNSKNDINSLGKDLHENIKALAENITYTEELQIPKIISENTVISENGIYIIKSDDLIELTLDKVTNGTKIQIIGVCLLKSKDEFFNGETELYLDFPNIGITLLFSNVWYVL